MLASVQMQTPPALWRPPAPEHAGGSLSGKVPVDRPVLSAATTAALIVLAVAIAAMVTVGVSFADNGSGSAGRTGAGPFGSRGSNGRSLGGPGRSGGGLGGLPGTGQFGGQAGGGQFAGPMQPNALPAG